MLTQTIRYIVRCQALDLLVEFDEFATAHTFAEQLAQDYPHTRIERTKITHYFDQWDDETGGEL